MILKHTQGGWNRNIKPASRYPTVFAGRNTHIARVITDGLTEAEAEANINLIAAAPDLLAALEAMHKHFITDGFNIGEEEEAIERVSMAAIAKAKGD